MLWLNPDRGGNRNPAFKQHNCGDAHHAEAGCKLRLLVDIDLADIHFAAVFLGQLVDDRREHAARAAPGRPEINQHGLLGCENLTLKIILCNSKNRHFENSFRLGRYCFARLHS